MKKKDKYININDKNQTILSHYIDDQKKIINLELKPYIQPFERILARAELFGLVNTNEIEPFSIQEKNSITITTNIDEKILIDRLVYWQRVGKRSLNPTLQVLIESTQVSKHSNNELPNKRLLRYGPHNIHEYRGKFFPQLVKSLINFSKIKKESIVIDPMCGSGTTGCEARLTEMSTIGLDINPLSVKIANFKSSILNSDVKILNSEVHSILNKLDVKKFRYKEYISWPLIDSEYLKNWFDEKSLSEIGYILKIIETVKDDNARELFSLNLSNILRKVSWQNDEDLRVRKNIKPYIKYTTLLEFKNELQSQMNRLVPFLELISKKKKFYNYEIKEGDAKCINTLFDEYVSKCDLLITSPPYAMALPYLDTDRLSLIILKMLSRKEVREKEKDLIGSREISDAQRKKIWSIYENRRSILPLDLTKFIDELEQKNNFSSIGFRKRNLPSLLGKYFLDMYDSMHSVKKMMKKDKYMCYVVGNNSTNINGLKTEITTHKYLWEIGISLGLKPIHQIDMELLTSKDIFRKNRGTSEKILIFKNGE